MIGGMKDYNQNNQTVSDNRPLDDELRKSADENMHAFVEVMTTMKIFIISLSEKNKQNTST